MRKNKRHIDPTSLGVDVPQSAAGAVRDIVSRFDDKPFTAQHVISVISSYPEYGACKHGDVPWTVRHTIRELVEQGVIEIVGPVRAGPVLRVYRNKK